MKKLKTKKTDEGIGIDYRTIGKKAGALLAVATIANASYAPMAVYAAYTTPVDATVNDETVDSDGQHVVSGGLTSGAIITSDGVQYVSSGGSATDTNISGGVQNVYDGGSTTGTSISGGAQNVYDGATATGTKINSDGVQNVSSGGSAVSAAVSAGGAQTVSAGGNTTDTAIHDGGQQTVFGTATGTKVNSGGLQHVSAGGNAVSATVSANGEQTVYSDGSATGTALSGGTQTVNAGGNTTDTAIHDGGQQTVFGTATGTKVDSGGSQHVSAGGNAVSATVAADGVQNVQSGGSATGTAISGGAQTVSAGGNAADTTIDGGQQTVFGTATGTKVNSGGSQHVSAGGNAVSATIAADGVQNVQSGGNATDTVIDGGKQNVFGIATNAKINSDGVQTVSSGGSAISAMISSGGSQVVEAGGRMIDTTVFSGGSALFATVSAGDTLNLYGGGYASGGMAAGATLNVVAHNAAAATYDSNIDMTGKKLNFDMENVTSGSTLLSMNGNTMTIDETTQIGFTGTKKLLTLDVGDDITLVDKTDGAFTNGTHTILGGATAFDFELDNTSNKLAATYAGVDRERTREQAKSYAEGKIAGVSHLHFATDLVTGQTLDSAWNMQYGTNSLFNAGGGTIKSKTGSHVESDAFNLVGGVSNKKDMGSYDLLTAAFLEGGWGSYDSYNSFSTGNVHGSGDTSHFGAGIMGKAEDKKGRYIETSLRGGKVDTDFSTSDLGTGADFDSDSTYLGIHIGIGQARKLKKGDVLDTYLKLFYTRQGSDSVTTGFGERVHFDAVNSTRLRVGAKYIKELRDTTKYYAGLAWEYEFSGKQKGSINGIRIDSPDMKGSSAIIEIGMKQELSKKWDFDINAQGLLGKREGIVGNLSFNYKF